MVSVDVLTVIDLVPGSRTVGCKKILLKLQEEQKIKMANNSADLFFKAKEFE